MLFFRLVKQTFHSGAFTSPFVYYSWFGCQNIVRLDRSLSGIKSYIYMYDLRETEVIF